MGSPIVVQNDWRGGMKQDAGIEHVPTNSAWVIENMIPGLGGYALGLRGGWTYASNEITATKATLENPLHFGWFPENTGAELWAWDAGGHAISVANATNVVTSRTDVPGADSNAVIYNNLLITPGGGFPASYSTAEAKTDLTGSPPAAKIIGVYRGYLLLANSSGLPNRIWFSDLFNPNSWDQSTTGRWMDVGGTITAVVTLDNAILVFSKNRTERIRGSIPGGGGRGGDLVLEPLFDQGVFNVHGAVYANDQIFFVNEAGVYQTDGANLVDLTQEAGMKRAWGSWIGPSTTTVFPMIGYARGHLFIVHTGTLGAGWMINVTDRSFFRVRFGLDGLTDIGSFSGIMTVLGDNEEVFVGLKEVGFANDAYLVRLTPMLLAQTDDHDGNGEAISGGLQTRSYLANGTTKRLRGLYLRYEITDPASANPTLEVEPNYEPIVAPGADLDSGNSFVFPETTDISRYRVRLNQSARSVAFSMATTGKGYPVGLQTIELEALERERTRS